MIGQTLSHYRLRMTLMRREWVAVAVILSLVPTLVSIAADPSTEKAIPQGLWRMVGYGTLIDARGGSLGVFEVTRETCVRLLEKDIDDYRLTRWGRIEQTVSGDELTLYARDGNLYRFSRETTLPAQCTSYEPTDDPPLNFDVFWHTFDERYAFFDLHGIDWRATRATYRPRVTESSTPKELFDIFAEMVEPLRDSHVSINVDDQRYSYEGYTLEDQEEEVWKLVRRKYLKGNYTTLLERLQYGRLSEKTGYLRIQSMWGFSLYDRASVQEELTLVDEAMDTILSDLKGVNKIILDLRFNGGGEDALARSFAARFTDRRRLAYSKRPRVGAPGEFAKPVQFYVEPPKGRPRFTGKTVVLINGATVSAAEIFLLCMEPIPHVTFVGEVSAGAYSDILRRALPNGWTFGLSNELYTNHEGKNYEGVGHNPDFDVKLTIEDLQKRRDTALEAAMKQ